MAREYIITGTDTGVGKTAVSAMLMQGFAQGGHTVNYWKPIQSGLEGMVDTRMVQKLSGLSDAYFLKEAYVLTEPLSPHRAAEIDGVEIDLDELEKPRVEGNLIIEGAGGLMVPITRRALFVNQFKRWDVPVILVARTGLGTINHTLLSIEALLARDIDVHGIIFVGERNIDNMMTIGQISGVKILGHMPMLDELSPASLQACFENNFNMSDFV